MMAKPEAALRRPQVPSRLRRLLGAPAPVSP